MIAGVGRLATGISAICPDELRERYPYDPFFQQQLDDDWRWGNDLLFSRVYYRLNEEWGFRMIHQLRPARHDGGTELQRLPRLLQRDGGARFRLRDHRAGKDDFSVSLVFSLKAMPSVGLGDDSNSLETRLFR
ncbi:MAG: hypothetical protein CM1200mP34_5650 [Verrucomicrobiales bacterium]|nr:MAG: hypothetical protein CM1200mP34_5650 [Verrucomicrobiales bacterium]